MFSKKEEIACLYANENYLVERGKLVIQKTEGRITRVISLSIQGRWAPVPGSRGNGFG